MQVKSLDFEYQKKIFPIVRGKLDINLDNNLDSNVDNNRDKNLDNNMPKLYLRYADDMPQICH